MTNPNESVAEQVEQAAMKMVDYADGNPYAYESAVMAFAALLDRVRVMEADAAAAREAAMRLREEGGYDNLCEIQYERGFHSRDEVATLVLSAAGLTWLAEYDTRHPEAQS